MPLRLPCRLTHGEKLDAADCYAELYLYPGGHYLLKFSIRSNTHLQAASVNVSFFLFDGDGAPVEAKGYGMAPGEACQIEAVRHGFPPERYETYTGKVTESSLARTAGLAICFREAEADINLDALGRRATPGTAIGE
ncbi:MAG: hypothetical protein HYU77_02745 [Betaproteobacteria bacterium]|nr:hypothetical protein [Betaproteobacteria bacterium]